MIVVRLLNNHLNSKIIQTNGIKVLMVSTFKHEELRTEVAEVNGMQAILKAMKKFDSDRDIQHYGLCALLNLFWTEIVHEETAKLLAKLGGIPFILDRMKWFSGDNDVFIGPAN